MAEVKAIVQRRKDEWVEVPAWLIGTDARAPIRLRPGTGDTHVTLEVLNSGEILVSLIDLRCGLREIEEEHQR